MPRRRREVGSGTGVGVGGVSLRGVSEKAKLAKLAVGPVPSVRYPEKVTVEIGVSDQMPAHELTKSLPANIFQTKDRIESSKMPTGFDKICFIGCDCISPYVAVYAYSARAAKMSPIQRQSYPDPYWQRGGPLMQKVVPLKRKQPRSPVD